jgi:hypothetical protein
MRKGIRRFGILVRFSQQNHCPLSELHNQISVTTMQSN